MAAHDSVAFQTMESIVRYSRPRSAFSTCDDRAEERIFEIHRKEKFVLLMDPCNLFPRQERMKEKV